jgi:hypothetical protein
MQSGEKFLRNLLNALLPNRAAPALGRVLKTYEGPGKTKYSCDVRIIKAGSLEDTDQDIAEMPINPIWAGQKKRGVYALPQPDQVVIVDQGSELTRLSSELTRLSSEPTRQGSELTRQGSELTRLSSELTRLSSELTRQGSELTRLSSELTHLSSKLTRQDSESTRQGSGPRKTRYSDCRTHVIFWPAGIDNRYRYCSGRGVCRSEFRVNGHR